MSGPEVILLRLAWPSSALWQNRRHHWRQQRLEARLAREAAWAEALIAGALQMPKTPQYTLCFSFYPPDRRKRDLHNMPATQKAAIDGIQDALGVDDSAFRVIWPTEWGAVCKGGSVLCEVRVAE